MSQDFKVRPDRNKAVKEVLGDGNSARSQMADALLRSFAGDQYDVSSAGTHTWSFKMRITCRLVSVVLLGAIAPCALAEVSETWAPQRMVWGFQVAYGRENDIPHNPTNSHARLLYAQPQIGITVWESTMSHMPFKRFEIVTEGIIGNAIHPGGHMFGDTLMFRFGGNEQKKYVPFFNVSSGPFHTTLNDRAPELGGHIQFLNQIGGGIQRRQTRNRSLVFEYRYFHISNASLATPNHGFNGSMLSIGLRWSKHTD